MDVVGDLQSRIRRLKSRLQTPETAVPVSPPAPPALDARLAALSQRIRHQSHRGAVELADAERAAALTASPSPPSPARLRQWLPRLEQYASALRLLDQAPNLELDAPTVQGAARARALVELALRLVRQAGDSANAAHEILPGIEAICHQTAGLIAKLREAIDRASGRLQRTERLRTLHDRLLQGERTLVAELRDLAQEIIDEIEHEWYPRLDPRKAASIPEAVAIHSLNVARVATFLAATDLNWRSQRQPLALTALVADLGMRGVAPEILLQTEPLNANQRAEIERHPLVAGVIIEQLPGIEPSCAVWAATHHERLDGSGYASGLAASSLEPASRLLAVADVYAACVCPRPYRTALGTKQALTEVLTEADGNRLDREWACKLLDLSFHPLGSLVELATGEIAEVIAPQVTQERPHLASLPVVRLRVDRHGRRVHVPIYRNLAVRPDCRIVRQLAGTEAAEVLSHSH